MALTHQVYITVLDENDNSPRFDFTSDSAVSVPEDCPVGQRVATVKARDPDAGSNGQVGTTSCQRALLPTAVQATPTTWHDREARLWPRLALPAPGPPCGPPQAHTCPAFPGPTPLVPQTLLKRTAGQRAQAPGPDLATVLPTPLTLSPEQVVFSLASGNVAGAFEIVTTNDSIGEVFVARPLDREERDHYLLKVGLASPRTGHCSPPRGSSAVTPGGQLPCCARHRGAGWEGGASGLLGRRAEAPPAVRTQREAGGAGRVLALHRQRPGEGCVLWLGLGLPVHGMGTRASTWPASAP